MTEEKNYSGYICSICNNIPLIQIIPKNGKVDILSLCQCNKKYQSLDLFVKNYYKINIPLDKISKQSIINYMPDIQDSNITSITEKFNKKKEEMEKHAKEIKDNLNEYIKSKDPDQLNDKYENYISLNNKIISLIEEFFNLLKIIDHQSIKINIINNSGFNTNFQKTPNSYLLKSSTDIYYQQAIKYFITEYIISEASIPEQLKQKFFYSPSNTVTCFLELGNKIYVSNCKKNPNMILYNLGDLNSKLKICIMAHTQNVIWIMKTSNNNLISCGDEGVIKIWPIISENIFSEIDKSKADPKNPNLINYNFEPLCEYHPEVQDMKTIKKLLNLSENTFLALCEKSIFLLDYSIENSNANINLKIKKDNIELVDLMLIQKKNERMIGAYSKNKLYLLNIETLEIIKEMEINNCPEKNCLIQLNENELMIPQKDPEPNLIVVDINNFRIKCNIKNNKYTDYLYKLKDGTFIQSGPKGICRYMISNYIELPILYKPFNDTEFDYPYDVYEKISCLEELDDGNLMMCVIIGKMSICNLAFI